jgi:hypothetical protein
LSGAGKFFAIAVTPLRANWINLRHSRARSCDRAPSDAARLCTDLARESQRGFSQIAFHHLVEQARAGQFLRHHRRARHDHVECGFEADCARQTLRAAGARQDAELHFRQRDLRAVRCDPVVSAKREFQTAAHRDAVDCGDHRLRAAFDSLDDRVQRRFLGCLGGIEFGDVRAARKGFAGARQHDGLDGRIVLRALDPFDDAGRVDRPSPLTGGLFSVMTATPS